MKQPTEPRRGRARILVVDDHPVVRRGLAQLINREPDLVICGEAGDARTALIAVADLKPDLAIVDISLPGGDGIELTKELQTRHPHLPVLVLSMHDEVLHAERALAAGARGYIRKQEATERMLLAIRQVLEGKIYLSETMRVRLADEPPNGHPDQVGPYLQHLAERELEVFCLVGQGLATRQIAAKLRLSVKTVETYLAHIKEKLRLKDATELLQAATLWAEQLPKE